MKSSVSYLQAPPNVSVQADLPSRAKGPALSLAHGAGGDLESLGLVALSAGLAARGHICARFNLPYREAGRGPPPPAEQSVEAYEETFTFLHKNVVGTRRRFAAGGASYGGRVASMAVARGMPAAALVFYSYPLHPPGKPEELRVAHWPEISVPCLFLVGTEDDYCELSLLKKHVRKLKGGADLQVVEGGDHQLAIPAKAAGDGRRHGEDEVLSLLSEVVSDWLRSL